AIFGGAVLIFAPFLTAFSMLGITAIGYGFVIFGIDLIVYAVGWAYNKRKKGAPNTNGQATTTNGEEVKNTKGQTNSPNGGATQQVSQKGANIFTQKQKQ
ncbi:MAG: hypothetical protein ACP5RT_02400, partial [Candidatus Micrarchaeia archaeon]